MHQPRREGAPSHPLSDDPLLLLRAKRDTLVERLNHGCALIEEKRKEGEDVTAWEDFWIGLLREYEEVEDRIRQIEANPEMATTHTTRNGRRRRRN